MKSYRKPIFILVGMVALCIVTADLVHRFAVSGKKKEKVEKLTSAAESCIHEIREGLPHDWSIERVLDHLALVTDEASMKDSPETGQGEACTRLDHEIDGAREFFGSEHFPFTTSFVSRVKGVARARRDKVENIAQSCRDFEKTLNELRADHGFEPVGIGLDGGPPPPLPRVLALPELPEGLERSSMLAWPCESAITALQLAFDRNQCPEGDARECAAAYATWITWSGTLSDRQALERPGNVPRWIRMQWAATESGDLFAVGFDFDSAGRGIVGQYPRQHASASTTALEMGPGANIKSVEGGVALMTKQGALFSPGSLFFEPVPALPKPKFTRLGCSAMAVLSFSDGSVMKIRLDGRVLYALHWDDPQAKDSLRALRLAEFSLGADPAPEVVFDSHSKRLVVTWLDGSSNRDVLILSPDGGRSWL